MTCYGITLRSNASISSFSTSMTWKFVSSVPRPSWSSRENRMLNPFFGTFFIFTSTTLLWPSLATKNKAKRWERKGGPCITTRFFRKSERGRWF
ncbi:hypothetical protein DM02DRAFT_3338 [Periconia macrospinosa]|uniref:Uncharacterized protein n=1 Tax=Periconia macrospinosa TaxID=97972 RepID=A0A2V1EDP4_9PLEO|nr:hypothetical protein DM02DRAFT_3338 [Periconia macrospinosa]